MGYPIQRLQTARPLVFLMVDAADHFTAKTGLTPTVTLSKNGASFEAAAGSVTEIGNGWYKVAGNATDSDTLGPMLLHATASGADDTDDRFDVVAIDPHTTRMNVGKWLDVDVATPSIDGVPKMDLHAVLGTPYTIQSGNPVVDVDPNGLDGVMLESGINIRQGLSVGMAVLCGRSSGHDGGNVTYFAMGNPGTTRLTSNVDVDIPGNRDSVTLNLPT